MRPISRAHLARLLAAQLTAAACGGKGLWWSEQEATHAAARTRTTAAQAAAAALELCADCPVRPGCAQLAAMDSYTGLSAGAVYINGHRHPPATVITRYRTDGDDAQAG